MATANDQRHPVFPAHFGPARPIPTRVGLAPFLLRCDQSSASRGQDSTAPNTKDLDQGMRATLRQPARGRVQTVSMPVCTYSWLHQRQSTRCSTSKTSTAAALKPTHHRLQSSLTLRARKDGRQKTNPIHAKTLVTPGTQRFLSSSPVRRGPLRRELGAGQFEKPDHGLRQLTVLGPNELHRQCALSAGQSPNGNRAPRVGVRRSLCSDRDAQARRDLSQYSLVLIDGSDVGTPTGVLGEFGQDKVSQPRKT